MNVVTIYDKMFGYFIGYVGEDVHISFERKEMDIKKCEFLKTQFEKRGYDNFVVKIE